MKKINIIYDFLSELGGLERVLFFMGNKLSKEYDTTLLFSFIDDDFKKEILKTYGLTKNIKIIEIQNGGFKNQSWKLFLSLINPGKLLQHNADLMISNSFLCSVMCYKNKIKKGIPYIVFLQHPPNFLYPPQNLKGWANSFPRKCAVLLKILFGDYLKNKDKIAVRNADKIFVNSENIYKKAREIYGVESNIIYPPVSDSFKKIDDKDAKSFIKRFNIKNKFILTHGRIIPDKRVDFIIKAIKEIENLDLVISGTIGEKLKENLLSLANQNGLSERVKIIGKISEDELVGLYNLAEAFVISAPKEDFGLTPIEAMACGTPVIFWKDGGGPCETVTEGVSGISAKPYDIMDLSNKIRFALESNLKNKNRKEIIKSVSKFSEKEIGKKLLEEVQKLLPK
ncbi:MAG: glycosyltransferase [Candidatus Pacearchaeota archaeon]